ESGFLCTPFRDVTDMESGGILVGFRDPGTADNAVFLPFSQNNIYSAVLPRDGRGGVNMFFTVKLSGCSIFVDKVTHVPPPDPAGAAGPDQIKVGDLIVYHANALSSSLPTQQVLANPTAPNIPARDRMRNQHFNAQIDYMHPAIVGLRLNVTPCGQCETADYMEVVNREMDRKISQWGSKVDFIGGTNVVGFLNGNTWEFWFQTWGWLSYSRVPSPSRSIPSPPTVGKLSQGLEVKEGRSQDKGSPPK